MLSNQAKGALAEGIVLKDYLDKGSCFLGRNVRCGGAELDLVFKNSSHLIFVEVRYLKKTNFMHPIESINHKKLLNLRRACEAYYSAYNQFEFDYRLDVATVTGSLDFPEIDIWIDVLEGY